MQPQNNPYEFIMDPSKQKRPGGPAFLRSPKNRIVVGVMFIAVILTILLIGFSLISSIGKSSNNDLLSVAAYQTEIARISGLGLKSAKDSSTKAKLATFSAFITTDSQSTINYINSTGKKLKPEELTMQKDSKVDKELESATQLNKYDETVIEILEAKSAAYKASLQRAINAASTPKEKQLLSTAANNILTYENAEIPKN